LSTTRSRDCLRRGTTGTRPSGHSSRAPPGYHVVEDLVAEGDKVAGRVTAYGKHEGELFGIPRTGKDIRVSGIAIWRIEDGKIVEHWHETNQLGLMQQLGVIPSPGGQA